MKNRLLLVLVVTVLVSLLGLSSFAQSNIIERYVEYEDITIYTKAYNYSAKEKEAIIFLHGIGRDYSDGEFLF